MWIIHRKKIRKLTFRAQALRRSESTSRIHFVRAQALHRSPSSEPFVGAIRSDEGLALETSAFESFYGG